VDSPRARLILPRHGWGRQSTARKRRAQLGMPRHGSARHAPGPPLQRGPPRRRRADLAAQGPRGPAPPPAAPRTMHRCAPRWPPWTHPRSSGQQTAAGSGRRRPIGVVGRDATGWVGVESAHARMGMRGWVGVSGCACVRVCVCACVRGCGGGNETRARVHTYM
jgi:hypothetical protein